MKMILAATAVLMLAACGVGDEETDEEAPAPDAPQLIGRVASINRAEGFALIEGFGQVVPGEGLLLSSVGENGRTATLVATGERLERYSAADLKSGEIEVGDVVYGRPGPAEAPEPVAVDRSAEARNDSSRYD